MPSARSSRLRVLGSSVPASPPKHPARSASGSAASPACRSRSRSEDVTRERRVGGLLVAQLLLGDKRETADVGEALQMTRRHPGPVKFLPVEGRLLVATDQLPAEPLELNRLDISAGERLDVAIPEPVPSHEGDLSSGRPPPWQGLQSALPASALASAT